MTLSRLPPPGSGDLMHPEMRRILTSSRGKSCEVSGCGRALRGHLRCADCTILVGPGHAEPALEDGRCWQCARSAERRAVRAARRAPLRRAARRAG